MKATMFAVAISILASAGLAAVAAYDLAAWSRARAKEASKSPMITGSIRSDGTYRQVGAEQ